MKTFKKVLRLCALVLFMVLALAGIGILGVAPILNKDRKLFADTESVSEHNEKTKSESRGQENLKL
jgi:hypothetical protein